MENKSNLSDSDLALIMSGQLRIDDDGNRRYYNDQGQLHREDGPAIVHAHGYQAWYRNGLRHRDDGPARIWRTGQKEFWIRGKIVEPF